VSGTAKVVYWITFLLALLVALALPFAPVVKAVVCAALGLALAGFAYWAERRGVWPD
jgi:Trk-type K+ transport system membrane component